MRLAPIALVFSAGLIALALGCGGSGEGEFREYGEIEGKAKRTRAGNGPDRQRPTEPTDSDSAAPNAAADSAQDASVASAETDAERDGNRIALVRPAVAEPADRRAENGIAGGGNLVQTAAVSTGTKPQAGNPLAVAAGTETEKPEPREIKLLVPSATFQEVGPEGAVRISYDDLDLLKILNMEPVPIDCADYFPDWLKALDGQRVRVRGFMYPTFQDTGLEGFVLARDNDICCFGRDPKRYDLIDVFMREGVTTDYIQGRPFDVVGVFHIEPEVYGGQLDRLYVIDDAIVIKP